MNNQPTTSLIQLETDGCIARVSLARPDKYNALNVQMITELNRGVFLDSRELRWSHWKTHF